MYQNTAYWVRIRKIIRLYEEMLHEVAQRHGLTGIETDIISFLQHNPGKDTAMDIVEFRMLSKGCVSKAVESLIQKGLIKREQDVQDRRKIHLHMLPTSKLVMADIEAVQEQFWKNIFHNFTEEEKKLYLQYGERILQNVQKVAERGTDR